MTAPVKITAATPGYDALMATLIGANTTQVASFQARVRATITAEQDAAKRSSRAGAR